MNTFIIIYAFTLIICDNVISLRCTTDRKEALNHSARDVFANNQKSISGGRTPPHFVSKHKLEQAYLYKSRYAHVDLQTVSLHVSLSLRVHLYVICIV